MNVTILQNKILQGVFSIILLVFVGSENIFPGKSLYRICIIKH